MGDIVIQNITLIHQIGLIWGERASFVHFQFSLFTMFSVIVLPVLEVLPT